MLEQATKAGFSTPLLSYHVKAGNLERPERGVYRLSTYPIDEQDDLIRLWMWSNMEGVFSHDTALSLHALSDVLPSQIHMTLPTQWKHRTIRIPDELQITYDLIPDQERTWHGTVPCTTIRRTIHDCIDDHLDHDLITQSVEQAHLRGALTNRQRIECYIHLGYLPDTVII